MRKVIRRPKAACVDWGRVFQRETNPFRFNATVDDPGAVFAEEGVAAVQREVQEPLQHDGPSTRTLLARRQHWSEEC